MRRRLAEFEQCCGCVVVLRSSAEAQAFVDAISTAAAGEPAVVSIAGRVSDERIQHGR